MVLVGRLGGRWRCGWRWRLHGQGESDGGIAIDVGTSLRVLEDHGPGSTLRGFLLDEHRVAEAGFIGLTDRC